MPQPSRMISMTGPRIARNLPTARRHTSAFPQVRD
jgi:hypothetical protein